MVTWKHYLLKLGKEILMFCFAIKSAAVSSNSFSLYTLLKKLWRLSVSHLLLMFRINKVASPTQESVPLIDLDSYSCDVVAKSNKYDDQLKELISFDEDATNKAFSEGYDYRRQAKIGLAEAAKDKILLQGLSECSYGLVKRR